MAADSAAAGDGISAAPAAIELDPVIAAQLMSMGVGESGCKRAAVAAQVSVRALVVRVLTTSQLDNSTSTTSQQDILLLHTLDEQQRRASPLINDGLCGAIWSFAAADAAEMQNAGV